MLNPGFCRRIEVYPSPGRVSAGLEDDVHRFLLQMEHDGRKIGAVKAKAERYPWSTCPGAPDFLVEQTTGKELADVARLDAGLHCTHLFDLAVVCAQHANDTAPTVFEMWVGDRVDGRTRATLMQNGKLVLTWETDGTTISGPCDWAGLDLRKLSAWRKELPPDVAEHATLMRRALFVSNVRTRVEETPPTVAADRPQRLGACFTYQLPRAREATYRPEQRRDFSQTPDRPLTGFDPNWR